MYSLGSRAGPGVVELGEQEVKGNLLESKEYPSIGDNALRSTRKKHLGVCLDVLAEDIVVRIEHVCGRYIPLCSFEVEIETINIGITEGTGLAGSFPLGGRGTISSEQKLRKPVCNIWCWEIVVSWPATTEREHDLLAPPLASIDGFTNARA